MAAETGKGQLEKNYNNLKKNAKYLQANAVIMPDPFCSCLRLYWTGVSGRANFFNTFIRGRKSASSFFLSLLAICNGEYSELYSPSHKVWIPESLMKKSNFLASSSLNL